jgi:hypothetical protein
MQKLKPMLLLAAVALSWGMLGCSAQAACEKQKECASDPPGEDFVRICQITYDGQINALRANKEDECHDLANAKLAYDACTSQLDCDDYREADHNGECEDERDDYFDAFQDAETECGTLD